LNISSRLGLRVLAVIAAKLSLVNSSGSLDYWGLGNIS
jgi:hypothetical protein